ncbi:hypothetical protein, partial [Corynebacterium canis]|uniref:hypothetical protein n=1 Tax=Corynebacterium canis TaxID=679663 RepID=UPI0031F0822C
MRQTVTKDMRQVVTKVMKQVVTKVLRDDSPKTLQIVFLFFVEHPKEEIQDDRRSTVAHNLSGQARAGEASQTIRVELSRTIGPTTSASGRSDRAGSASCGNTAARRSACRICLSAENHWPISAPSHFTTDRLRATTPAASGYAPPPRLPMGCAQPLTWARLSILH